MKNQKWMKWLETHNYIVKGLILSFVPLLCCVVTCAVQGKTIGNVYLPSSLWNDELFYFKQVEAILEYGFPQGYYGFNESHALKLSFAAWSPALVWPWLIWGLLFGWNMMSPIYCNIAIMMLTMFGFTCLVKPSNKQLGMLALMFVTFTPFTRYMLSTMPEVICFSMVIMTFAVGVSYQQKEHVAKWILLFAMTGLMTLMRPYLILFMLLPVYFAWQKRKWIGLLGSGVYGAVIGVFYLLINHYLGAEYFRALFDTTWVTTFLRQGIGEGFSYFFGRLRSEGAAFFFWMGQGFKAGHPVGARFGGFMVVMAVLLFHGISNLLKKQKKQAERNLFLALCFVGMWAALILMYRMEEGSKHLLTFIAVGIFAISLMETKFYRKTILTAGVFAYLYMAVATSPDFYQIPFAQDTLVQEVENWQETFEEKVPLSPELGFENVVIWTLDGEGKDSAPWQLLYGAKKGMGISCCYKEYVVANIEELQSKYIAVGQSGEVRALCEQKGYELLYEAGGMALFQRYE
ncbi:MAG: glycosyltransferase family 39 protein [Lachnospiraceae bacterium]|nr:glycosyltransferase family 39 protein [Lachnospiraceae bacterium]